ncbi:MAG TPA: amidohydrolase family protein [Polyangiaceae bacterium]|nr:amidohydrolase family protein [Polyangiaceae bacterium]
MSARAVKAPLGTQSGEVLLRGATLVTCDRADTVLRGDVLIRDGRLAAIGRVRARAGASIIDARDRIILPGLVMAHIHLCQTLMRGMADDLPLLDWLRRRIWPLEAAHDDASLRSSAELGLAELISAGTTAILDLGTRHNHDVVFDACVRAGVRVAGGKSLMDSGSGLPRGLRQSLTDNLRDGERLERSWSAHPSGRIRYAWIPRFVLSCSEALVRGALERAADGGSLFHTHASEHASERRAVREQFGVDDVALLRRWGARGPRVSFAHGVQLTNAQIAQLAADGTQIVSCPSANLKLGSGVARLSVMQAAGVSVGLGADGAPCNNNLDPWIEIRHAALLANARSGPGTLPARSVLRMATINGARVLGLDDQIGSLEVGKQADLVVVRSDGPHVAPATDPIATLVYATQARDVEHVFVAGRCLVRAGELIPFESARVVHEARSQAQRLRRRAAI